MNINSHIKGILRFLHFIVIIPAYSYSITSTSPRLIQLQQKYRHSHSTLKVQTHFNSKIGILKKLGVIDNTLDIFTYPLFKNQNTLITGYGFLSYNHWKAFVQPSICNSEIGENVIGTNFEKFGLIGRFVNSFIFYENKFGYLFIGRAPVHWGQSLSNSIIQSGNTPQYDHIYLRAKLGRFNWDILNGRLNSQYIEDKRIVRHIAGHKISGTYFENKLIVEIGEQIIYTGENRPLELIYLNPAVPYFFSAYEGEEVSLPAGFDNDNGIIFSDFRWNIKPDFSVYGEFIMDDFQLDDTNVQNMMGYKIGADGAFNFIELPITWESEYTKVDSWTYIHGGQFTTWENRDHAIGYPYGPDVLSFRLQADAWLKQDKVLFNCEYTWLEKGYNTLNTPWANTNTINDPFPSKPSTIFNLFESSISYWMKYGIMEAGWSNIPFANEIAFEGRKTLKGSFFIKLQLLYEFGFDLEDSSN